MSAPVLAFRGLHVRFPVPGGEVHAVRGIDLDLHEGECVAIVGESGSGKSSVALALLGLSADGAEVEADRLELFGEDLRDADETAWRRLRGASAGLVLQDALVSLDPLRTIGSEVGETLRLHRMADRGGARDAAREAMGRAGLADPIAIERRRPVELSGGMRQRALIASAIVASPGLVVADEPTTALDAVVQRQVVDTLATLRGRSTAVLLISHDLRLVARAATRVVVMKDGEIVETGPTSVVLTSPEHEYTRQLIALRPSLSTALETERTGAVIEAAVAESAVADDGLAGADVELEGIGKHYRRAGVDRTVLAGVDLHVEAGSAVGIVGPSGGGKTTIARLVTGLLRPDAGRVLVDGGPPRRRGRPSPVQLIPQDATSSFDPRWTVRRIIAEGLDADPALRRADRGRRSARILELLDEVGLAHDLVDRRPERLSGGQRQRVAIARALAARPRVLVCDESVAALDVAVQARIVALLIRLRAEHGFTLLFISHDLGVVAQLCERVVVVADGRIVEQGRLSSLFAAPEHPVTAALVAASRDDPTPTATETA